MKTVLIPALLFTLWGNPSVRSAGFGTGLNGDGPTYASCTDKYGKLYEAHCKAPYRAYCREPEPGACQCGCVYPIY
jgi:hypothetical protein